MPADTVAEDGHRQPVVRVVICDDHAVFRRGLMLVLELDERVQVVGEAADGGAALALAQDLVPDVVLMDVRMPGMSGIDTTRRMAAALPSTRIIMLTVSDEEDDLFEAMKAGAAGYLLKEISIDEIGESVRNVHRGQRLVTPSLAAKLITEFAGIARRPVDRRLEPPQLTPRELEVLAAIAEGKSNAAISDALVLTKRAVEKHINAIFLKLNLSHSQSAEDVSPRVKAALVFLAESDGR